MLRLPHLAALALGLFTATSSSAIIYATGNFIDSEWTNTQDPSTTGSSSGVTQATGGDPGAYRRISLTVGSFQYAGNIAIWDTATYTPSIQGSVDTATIEYDIARVFNTTPTALQVAKGLAVMQDGEIHTHYLGTSTANTSNWAHVSSGDIKAFFPDVDWHQGSAITFGFYNSTGAGGTGFTIDGGYDNFSVEVIAIPEPSTYAALASLATLAIVALRRRKARA